MTDAQAWLTADTKNGSYRSAKQGEDCSLLPSYKAVDIEQLILANIQ